MTMGHTLNTYTDTNREGERERERQKTETETERQGDRRSEERRVGKECT